MTDTITVKPENKYIAFILTDPDQFFRIKSIDRFREAFR